MSKKRGNKREQLQKLLFASKDYSGIQHPKGFKKYYSRGLTELRKEILENKNTKSLNLLINAYFGVLEKLKYMVEKDNETFEEIKALKKHNTSLMNEVADNYLRTCKLVNILDNITTEKHKFYFLYVAVTTHLSSYVKDKSIVDEIIEKALADFQKHLHQQSQMLHNVANNLKEATPEDIEKEFSDLIIDDEERAREYFKDKTNNNSNNNKDLLDNNDFSNDVVGFDLNSSAITDEELNEIIRSLENPNNPSEENNQDNE